MATFFKGFSTVNRTYKNNVLYDIDLIKQDLLNQFHTRKGDRVMLPDFGSIIWDMMFEPLTAANRELIEEDVRRIISSEPRVAIESLNVTNNEHGIMVAVNLFYTPLNAISTLEVAFDRRYAENTLLT